jgi:hypothetical protein
MVSLSITGAMRTGPTAAIWVLLELPPLLLQLEGEVRDSNAAINGNPNLKVLDTHT